MEWGDEATMIGRTRFPSGVRSLGGQRRRQRCGDRLRGRKTPNQRRIEPAYGSRQGYFNVSSDNSMIMRHTKRAQQNSMTSCPALLMENRQVPEVSLIPPSDGTWKVGAASSNVRISGELSANRMLMKWTSRSKCSCVVTTKLSRTPR